MEGFTLIDAGVAIIILISGVLAYSRGLVRETMAIVGWVGAAVVAFIFADQVEPLIKQVPVLGDFIGDSCELAIIAAFAAVFAVALIVVSIFTPLFSSVVQRSAIGGIDQARIVGKAKIVVGAEIDHLSIAGRAWRYYPARLRRM